MNSGAETVDGSEVPGRVLALRRVLFFGGTTLLWAAGCVLMTDLVWRIGVNGARVLLLGLFAVLFFFVCLGFTHALTGFLLMLRGGRRGLVTGAPWNEQAGPTAIVFSVCNEGVERVFAGLKAVYLSLRETGRGDWFEFFVLSDSRDPDHWVEEEMAWARLCLELDGFGRIFYRRRRENVNRKSGNIADFCRKWGGRYKYMIVFDADSVMAGADIVRLVETMEANPRVGILQTAPRVFGGESLFGRVQQFASRVYGPLFCAGLDYWQGSEGNYWGHNAIIRLEPFIEYCDLPDLPGREPFGGKILSHDFVEAALMRQAGWEVWLLHELEGSWEEAPQSVIDSAKRDRRWCQGNLQHNWLLFSRRLRPASKLHLLMGIMGYAMSPLWFAFLALGSWVGISHRLSGLSLIPIGGWAGRWFGWSLAVEGAVVLAYTLVLLFGPKLLAWVRLWMDGERARACGGVAHAGVSIAMEIVFSSLLAPVFMLFHSKFILWMFLGRAVEWKTQRRGAGEGTGWLEAAHAHGGQTVLGIAWGILAWNLDRTLFWWLSPVLMGMVLSVPVSVWSARAGLGRALRRAGLMLIPEESAPAPELRWLERFVGEARPPLPGAAGVGGMHRGLTAAVVDPYVNGVHASLLEPVPEEVRDGLRALAARLLAEGPEALSGSERIDLMYDPEIMSTLHRQVWVMPRRDLAGWWHRVAEAYRLAG